ncbi:MAG: hypothetical protein K9L98_00535 [Candidatus Pacebacteria bacterium]|nr:hypothetical protein [Candidatus Paceibacterota bacterium]MCF7862485.1 hypothetical protein [Candidatus Paceibacterota bacterium]
MQDPFYDPQKSYEENFEKGPFGVFADGEAFENLGEPQYDFFGVPVFSPFGIPAGPLINGRFVQSALDKGFDIVTYKTVRSEEYPSHPWPNVLAVDTFGDLTFEKAEEGLIGTNEYKEPVSITNSFGVPSKDVAFWQKDLMAVLNKVKKGQIVVGAFQGTKKEGQNAEDYIKDFGVTAKLLKDTGVKVIEVNLSCPNEGTNNLLCYDIDRSVKVAKVIKEEIGDIPLIVKIGYYKEQELLEKFVREVGSIVQGISAINTISAKILDKDSNQALPGEGRLRSGVCGSGIKWAGLDMVKRLYDLRQKLDLEFKIIGVGGVVNKNDFKEYMDSGADFVMSATGAMWNPYLAQDIKKSL